MPPQGSTAPEIIPPQTQPIIATQDSGDFPQSSSPVKHGKFKIATLVIIGILFLGLAGSVVYAVTSTNKPANKANYQTACFKVTIPKVYKVTNSSGACQTKAVSGFGSLNYVAVDDSATSSKALFTDQKDKIFGSSKNGFFGNSSEADLTIDGQPAHLYSFDTPDRQTIKAYFVHTNKTYDISGNPVQNFVIIQDESDSSLFSIFQPKIDIPSSTKWKDSNYIDAAQFNKFTTQARTAWQLKDYKTLVQLSNMELSLANTDKEKSGAYYWRGVGENGMGLAAQAEADERLAISLDSSSVGPLVTLGAVLIGKGDFTNAMDYAQKAVALDPTYAWAYNLRGLVYLDTGNKQAGITDLKKAIQLEPTQAVFQQNLNTALR